MVWVEILILNNMWKLIKEVINKKLELISKRLSEKMSHKEHIHTWEFLEESRVFEYHHRKGELPHHVYRIYECTDPTCKKTKKERI